MKKFERNQELLDRFTTKAQYKEFLGKKIKDFTKEEKSIYNRIAQQEKRNPFGKEIKDTTSQFIDVSSPLPFADPKQKADPRRLLRSRRKAEVVPEGVPIDDEEEYIPTIADMRKVLRAAGKLDRTPPQLHFTPIVNAAKEDDEPVVEPLPVNERRSERVIGDLLKMELGGTQALGLDDRKAFLGALSIIGEKKRLERAEEIMGDLARQENPPSLDEARAIVDSAINEHDREARAVSADKKQAYKEMMDSEVGELKLALDRFNIPSDYLLQPTKKMSRKKVLKASQPEWYERGLPVPVSPREKRVDLQFGIDDPDDEFDPDPVISFDDDDEWLKEYLREDVMEARAREDIKKGIIKDPRPRRRAIEGGMSVEEANRIYGTEEDILTRKEVVFDGNEGTEADIKKVVEGAEGAELERLLGFRPTIPEEPQVEAPVEPYIPPNIWKEGTREHSRYADKMIQQELSEGGRFPPNVFTEERGRIQFGFNPQRTTLPTTDLEEFSLDPSLPSWALDARSGKDTFDDTYIPDEPDIGDDTYIPPEELALFSEGGRSMLGGSEVGRRSVFLPARDKPKEDEEPITEPLLPADIRNIIDLTGSKEVVADNPEIEVIEPIESLANTTTAGSGFVGEAPAVPKLSRYERRKRGLDKKKKKKKKGTLPTPKPEVVASTLPRAEVAQPTATMFGDAPAGFLQPIAQPLRAPTFEEQLRMGDEFVEPEGGSFGYSGQSQFAGLGGGTYYR